MAVGTWPAYLFWLRHERPSHAETSTARRGRVVRLQPRTLLPGSLPPVPRVFQRIGTAHCLGSDGILRSVLAPLQWPPRLGDAGGGDGFTDVLQDSPNIHRLGHLFPTVPMSPNATARPVWSWYPRHACGLGNCLLIGYGRPHVLEREASVSCLLSLNQQSLSADARTENCG